MNYKIFIIIALVASVLLSGCLNNKIKVNESKMADKELIDNFCQSKGYDSGITEAPDPMAFYEYKQTIPNTDFQYSNFNREIVCTKTITKKEYNQYDYNDLYHWIKRI